MAANRTFTIRFQKAEAAGIYGEEFTRFQRSIRTLASDLGEKGLPFTEVRAAFSPSTINGRPVVEVAVSFIDGSERTIQVRRTIDIERKTLVNNELVFNRPVRFEGYTRDFSRLSARLVSSFGLTSIRQTTSLENATYSALRKGFAPSDFAGLDSLFVGKENTDLSRAQIRDWLALTDTEKRAFVKSSRFQGYKQALFNEKLALSAPVATPAQRALVFSQTREANRFLTTRNKAQAETRRLVTEAVAEARIERAITRNRALRTAQRRGIGTPAFASLTDRFLAYSIDLAAFTENARARTLEIYGRIELDLIAEIQRIDASSAVRPDTRQKRLAALLLQTRVILTDGIESIRRQNLGELTNLAQLEASFTASNINAVIGVNVASPGITPTQVRQILSDTIITGVPQREYWSRQSQKVVNAFTDSVRQGLISGENTQQIVSRVQGTPTGRRTAYRTKAGALRFKVEYQGGVLQGSRREATALVRTSINSVSNSVREQTIKENRSVIKGMQFVSTLDARTSPICQHNSGLVWDLEGNGIGHSEPYNPPPLHINCRSTLVAITKSWEELAGPTKKNIARQIDEKQALTERTQASADGLVPADRTYEQWLNTKGETTQREILGRRRFDLWKAGDIFISAPRVA